MHALYRDACLEKVWVKSPERKTKEVQGGNLRIPQAKATSQRLTPRAYEPIVPKPRGTFQALTAPVLKEANVKRDSTLTPRMVPSTTCIHSSRCTQRVACWMSAARKWLQARSLIHAMVDKISNLGKCWQLLQHLP